MLRFEMPTAQQGLYLGGSVLLAVASSALTHNCTQARAEAKQQRVTNEFLEQQASDHLVIETVRNERNTFEDAFHASEADKADLAALLQETQRNAARDTREIITVYTEVPGEVVEIRAPVPQDYLFALSNGLIVAEALYQEGGQQYTTFDQRFRGTVVVGEKRSGATIEMSTGHDPDTWAQVDVDLDVQSVVDEKRPIFMPHVAMGGVVDVVWSPGRTPTVQLLVSISSPLIHPTEDLDFVAPAIRFNDKTFRVGLDVIGYNVGSHMAPVFSDLWLTAGVDYDPFNATWGFGGGVSSKF